ncbi:hypothetical protein JCM19233_7229 [Vibrio astriarenae]|nr:hypothetical protein JCM19233_7229 [Vibrio sp. C7]
MWCDYRGHRINNHDKRDEKSLVVMFIVSTLAIAGCGQSGALYLPQDDTQSEQTQQQ